MAGYGKKIIYLSYMKDGDKVKSAGFMKIVTEKGRCGMDMHLSGVCDVNNGKYDVCATSFDGTELVLGQVYLHRGKGEWKTEYLGGIAMESNCMAGESKKKKLAYSDIDFFTVKISGTKWLEGSSNNEKMSLLQKKENSGEESAKKWRGNEKRNEKEFHAELKAGWIDEMEAPELVSVYSEKADIRDGEYGEDKGVIPKNGIDMENIILNDKWDQLCQIFPVIHPYEDERQYISIQPKDFVVMTGDYQHLANNSFLLHGFYNYRHIILGNEKAEGGFYLGVPGVYYEREKMVALMFGFEAFECSGGKAEAGKFGYYLRKVRI